MYEYILYHTPVCFIELIPTLVIYFSCFYLQLVIGLLSTKSADIFIFFRGAFVYRFSIAKEYLFRNRLKRCWVCSAWIWTVMDQQGSSIQPCCGISSIPHRRPCLSRPHNALCPHKAVRVYYIQSIL